MAKKVADLCKENNALFHKASHDKRSYKVSFKKFNDFAGIYKPTITIKNIIQDLIKNYRLNKLLSLRNYYY